jgi:hypothetical protein
MVLHGESLMKVVSYLSTVPFRNNKLEKTELLKKFINGVNLAGDTGIVYTGNSIIESDMAVIQGWTHQLNQTAPHLKLRRNIINTQKRVCVADANLFLFASITNDPHYYLRYSFNGVFPTTGNYFDSEVDTARWSQIKKDLGIEVLPYKTTGSTILLCVQRNGGWSMGEQDVYSWIVSIVNDIRKYSNRPIVVRPHPGDKTANSTYLQKIKMLPNIKVSINKALDEDLQNAWAVVNHNSSSIVGPIIKGCHAFVTDPNNSQCREVADSNFANIETPQLFDRQSWLERISMFHWNFEELENGNAWKHFRKFV